MGHPNTMRAAVYRPGNTNLIVEHNFPVPQLRKGEVLIKVAACGACHSDTFLLTNAIIDDRTYVFGHETVGHAVELGEGVEGIEIDKLYALHAIVPCAKGSLPPIDDSTGIGFNGGFAEYVAVDHRQLVPVPYGLSPEVAAVAADSLITVFNAVHNTAELRPGMTKRVLIYGVGGLGHQALQLAKAYGATVFAVDYKRAARNLAIELGAERAFSLSELARETAAGKFTVDIVFDFVVNEQSFSLSKAATKPNGLGFDKPPSKIVLVGVSAENLPLNSAEIIEFPTLVLPSLYGSIDDLKNSLRLLEDRTVQPIINLAPLEKVDQAINDLRASAVFGRRIIVPTLRV
ncbi:GroES-like protein [Trametes elegans]|nr:GroES-like protein [Trametes elegans]